MILNRYKSAWAVGIGAGLVSLGAVAATHQLDVAHTAVEFGVKHLMVSTTKGGFRKLNGTLDFDEKAQMIKNIQVEIDAASVDTRNDKRDEHLRSADFFDVGKYPTITFKADPIRFKVGKSQKVKGMLMMHGVEKPIELELTVFEKQTDPWGVAHQGFALKGKLNRKDFGLTWNKALDKGGVAVGDEVTIDIQGEVVPKSG